MTDETPTPTLAVRKMLAVMNDVRELAKGEYNQQQQYRFRGVDAVMNAVGPAFRNHGIVVQSSVIELRVDSFQTSKGTVMNRAIVAVEFRFTADDESFVSAQSYGEASDTMDKSVPKAMSVAYRTALLQALCLPTHEQDPDQSESYERVASGYQPDTRDAAFAQLRAVVRTKGLGENNVPDAMLAKMGVQPKDATLEQIQEYTAFVEETGRLGDEQQPGQ